MLADMDEPALAAAAASMAADGIEAAATVTDVSDPDSVDALARATLSRFDAVHVVCNNAGVSRGGPRLGDPAGDVELDRGRQPVRHRARNPVVRAVSHCARRRPRRQHGVGSRADSPGVGGPLQRHQAAAVAVSETLHHELKAIGSPVGVSVLCPGPVRTEIHQSYQHWSGRFGPRPEVEDSSDIAAWRRGKATMVKAGADPAVIATAVEQAIVGNRFWILTHPEYAGAFRARYRGMVRESGGPRSATWAQRVHLRKRTT